MGKTPIVRPVSWLNVAVALVMPSVFMVVSLWLYGTMGVILALGAFLIISNLLRLSLARHHRAGIAYSKRQEFRLAISSFERSLEFFRRYPWIDRFRAITMFSGAGMSYREMGLVSIAFGYTQIGDGNRARHYYKQCLQEFPDNGMAEAALRLMDAGRES